MSQGARGGFSGSGAVGGSFLSLCFVFSPVVFTVTLFSGRHSSPSRNCKKLGKGLGRQGCLKAVYSSFYKSKPLIRVVLFSMTVSNGVFFSVAQFGVKLLF